MKLICRRGMEREYQDEETGSSFFSVSQVIKVLDPEAFDDVPYEILEAACYRGSRIHHLFSKLLAAQIGVWTEPIDCPEEFRGYFMSLVRWVQANHVKPRKIELASVDPLRPVAGRPDAEILYGPTMFPALCELKTGKGRRRAHRVQCQAYRRFKGYQHLKKMVTVYAQADGSMAREEWVEQNPADEAWFDNGLNVLLGRYLHG